MWPGRKKEKNAKNSGRHILPAVPKGSARTSLGPMFVGGSPPLDEEGQAQCSQNYYRIASNGNNW